MAIQRICFVCYETYPKKINRIHFADFKPLVQPDDPKDWIFGDSSNFGYYCEKHYPAALKLAHLTFQQAQDELEKEFGKFSPYPPPRPSLLKRLGMWLGICKS